MNSVSFGKQTIVYFKKIARIAVREKVWIFLAFALIISLIVSLVVSGDMFEDYESTKSGFFTLASACIWIGIFNSIQSICKEHDIIRSDYRQVFYYHIYADIWISSDGPYGIIIFRNSYNCYENYAFCTYIAIDYEWCPF